MHDSTITLSRLPKIVRMMKWIAIDCNNYATHVFASIHHFNVKPGSKHSKNSLKLGTADKWFWLVFIHPMLRVICKCLRTSNWNETLKNWWKVLFCWESKFNAIYVLNMISGMWPSRLIVTKNIQSVQLLTTFSNISGLI